VNYENIKDMTNEEAVAYYSPITVGYIPCGDLENLLGWADLAKRNAVSGAWEGSLIDFMIMQGMVPALSDGLRELFSHLNKPRSIGCDTDSQPWASKMADLLSGLEAVDMIDASLTADVVALAGGYAYPDLDVDAVQLLRDEEAQRVLDQEAADAEAVAREAVKAQAGRYTSLYNAHISSLMTGTDASDATWVAALQAMADNFIKE
jgi:hypothetical protein